MSTETAPLLAIADAEDPNHRMCDVVLVGTAFFFIFSAYAVFLTLASTVLPPSVAFNSSGALYVAMALSNLFLASAIVDRIGARLGLFLAALTYPLFNVGHIVALDYSGNEVVQVNDDPSICGHTVWAWCGGPLDQLYLAKCSTPKNLGRYVGVVFGFMGASGVIGPLFCSTLVNANLDARGVFQVATGFGTVGVMLLAYLWILRPEPSNPWKLEAPASIVSDDAHLAPRNSDNNCPAYLKTLKLCLTSKMLLMMPICYASGLQQSFQGSSMPLFVKTSSPSSDLAIKLFLRGVLGAFNTLTPLLIGPLIDRHTPRPMVLVSLLFQIACQSMVVFNSPINNLPVLCASNAILGFTSGIIVTLGQKMIGTLFEGDFLSQGFAGYKFHTSVGAAVCYFFSNATLDQNGFPNMYIWAPLFLGLFGACVVN
ncbi:DUF895 domain membrane protein [Entophlyctis luteolus]|nr:DUF895 domain membrane protein [Entophlyctis luteolus]